MGLRETLNEHPGATTVGTALIILVAIVFAVFQFTRSGGAGAGGTGELRGFFTIDDGQTWFEDSMRRLPPFEHQGKTAVRARLFTCDGGKTKFVGYLERFTPEMKKHIEEQQRGTGGIPLEMQEGSGIEIKKPGDKTWIQRSDPNSIKLIESITCPDGSTESLEMVPEPM